MADSLRYYNKITQKFKYLKLLKDQKILTQKLLKQNKIYITKQQRNIRER